MHATVVINEGAIPGFKPQCYTVLCEVRQQLFQRLPLDAFILLNIQRCSVDLDIGGVDVPEQNSLGAFFYYIRRNMDWIVRNLEPWLKQYLSLFSTQLDIIDT